MDVGIRGTVVVRLEGVGIGRTVMVVRLEWLWEHDDEIRKWVR